MLWLLGALRCIIRVMNTHFDYPTVIRIEGAAEFLRVNSIFEELVGLTASDLSAQPFLKWIHPEERASLEAVLKAETGCATARHQTKEGKWLPFDWQVRTHTDGCAVLGRHRDSTIVSRQEAMQSPYPHGTLAQTLEAMARIVEARNPGMLCSILLVDSAHEHVTVGAGPSLPQEYNDAVEGLKIGPTVGSCGTAAFWDVPVIVSDIAADPLWKDLRDVAAMAGVSACWSHPITATSGKVIGATALYDRERRVPTEDQIHGLEIAARMIGLAIERDNLEAQLHQAAKMEALGILAGGIAHDFNNILAVVMGNAELALDTLPSGSAAKRFLTDIVSASEGATDLCKQMLAYAGKGVISTETIECNSFIKEIGGLLQVALSKKATLVYELADTPLGVLADRAQFRQVIMNLITNASEALCGEPGRIVLATSANTYGREDPELFRPDTRLEPGDYVCLRVSDTGAGMSSRTRARIFDPFFSTKAAGRGLGLAAVQGIVTSHGGTIALESEEGKGTAFTLMLPRVPVAVATVPATPTGRSDFVGAQVLVVDDNPQVRSILVKILENAGYIVTCASDGQEGADAFRKNADRIECVLLDFSLPKLSGIEVLGEIRKIRPKVPVILCSGYAEQEVLERLGDVDLTYAIKKPWANNILLRKVAEALEGVRSP